MRLDGDVIVNAQLANRRAPEIGWSAVEELTLYVVHGLLHLLGYDDMDAQSLTKMRHREALHLRQILGHVCPDRHAGLQVASASKEETT